eukprot:240030_1
MNLLLMMRYHNRSMIMQAELFMTEAIGHNSGAFHPGIESGHIVNVEKIRSTHRLLFLDAPELHYRLINRPINRSIDRPINRSIHIHPHRPLHYIKLYVIDNIKIIYFYTVDYNRRKYQEEVIFAEYIYHVIAY